MTDLSGPDSDHPATAVDADPLVAGPGRLAAFAFAAADQDLPAIPDARNWRAEAGKAPLAGDLPHLAVKRLFPATPGLAHGLGAARLDPLRLDLRRELARSTVQRNRRLRTLGALEAVVALRSVGLELTPPGEAAVADPEWLSDLAPAPDIPAEPELSGPSPTPWLSHRPIWQLRNARALDFAQTIAAASGMRNRRKSLARATLQIMALRMAALPGTPEASQDDWRSEVLGISAAAPPPDTRAATPAGPAWRVHGPAKAKDAAALLDLRRIIDSSTIRRSRAQRLIQSVTEIDERRAATMLAKLAHVAIPTGRHWIGEMDRSVPEPLAQTTEQGPVASPWAAMVSGQRKLNAFAMDLDVQTEGIALRRHQGRRYAAAAATLDMLRAATLLPALPPARGPRHADWRAEAQVALQERFGRFPRYPADRAVFGLGRSSIDPRRETERFKRALLESLPRFSEATDGAQGSFLRWVRRSGIALRAARSSDQSVVAVLSQIHAALQRRTPAALDIAVARAQRLPLDAALCAGLSQVASRWSAAGRPAVDSQAIDVLLRATGWRLDLAGPQRGTNADEPGQSWTAVDLGQSDPSLSARSSRWIVAGDVPLAWIGRVPRGDLTLVTLASRSKNRLDPSEVRSLRAPGSDTRLVTARDVVMATYSTEEDELSGHTARLAGLLVEALKGILGQSLQRDWLDMLELVFDDLLFGSNRDFWTQVAWLRQNPDQGKGAFCASPDMAAAFLGALHGGQVKGRVRIISPRPVPASVVTDEAALLAHLLATLSAGFSEANGDGLRRDAALALTETAIPPLPQGSVLLVGRKHDRNYVTDLQELGRTMQRAGQPVVFLPSALRSVLGRVVNIFEDEPTDWYDADLPAAAETLPKRFSMPWTAKRPEALHALVRWLHLRRKLTPVDLALLLAARLRIERFCSEGLLRHLEAGALVEHQVRALRPKFLTLLPGRDYLARVAAVAARAEQVTSFDMQTVFATTRSRYKRTMADYQLAIESESRRLFEVAFDLPGHRVLQAGCAKIGKLRTAAETLSRTEMRELAGLKHEYHIVFACSPFLADDRAILEQLVAALDLWPDVRLGMRAHPSPSEGYLDFCQALCRDQPRAVLLSGLDLPQTIVSADLVVTRFSNVGLEAGLVGRDVISCSFTDEMPPVRLDLMGVSIPALSGPELVAVVEDFRSQGPRWRQLQNSRQAFAQANPQLFVASAPAYVFDLMQRHAGSPQAGSP